MPRRTLGGYGHGKAILLARLNSSGQLPTVGLMAPRSLEDEPTCFATAKRSAYLVGLTVLEVDLVVLAGDLVGLADL